MAMASTPEELFSQLLMSEGHDITDPCNINCDLCFKNVDESNGGYVLVEKKTVKQQYSVN